MSYTVVGISEMAVGCGNGEVFVTYSLGSCLGMTVYDPKTHVSGMIHCMLPLSKIDRNKAQAIPAMFVDTGVPLLLQKMFNVGAERKRLIVKVAGCAQLLDDRKLFNIGKRNYTVLRKILWKNNILIDAEEVFGSVSRSLWLNTGTGRAWVKSAGQERVL